jgi:cobalt-zinc-cadmium efflux system protein
MTLVFLVVELVVGIWTGSLALAADAVHMFTDAGALALAGFAAWLSEREASPQQTYGYYRVEILAALVNGILLLGSTGFIVYEAIRRFQQPAPVVGWPMLVVAALGLVVNLAGIFILRSGAATNLNVQGAFYEVIKDALGSVGVIVAGVLILTLDFTLADPIVSMLIALLILPRTWTLLTEAVNVLMESAPEAVEIDGVRDTLQRLEGVESAHDVHVWSLSTEMHLMSAHLVVAPGVGCQDAQAILSIACRTLESEFGIQHVTLQIEYDDRQELELSGV